MRPIPYDPLQPYYNRSFMLHQLDRRHFDALNQTQVYRDAQGTLHEAGPAAVQFYNGYCLDAIDSIPGGSMCGPKCGPIQTYVQRNDLGTSPEDRRWREQFAARLIAEIMAEEKKE